MTPPPAAYLPIPSNKQPAIDPTLTVPTFIGQVPMDAHRSILVYRLWVHAMYAKHEAEKRDGATGKARSTIRHEI